MKKRNTFRKKTRRISARRVESENRLKAHPLMAELQKVCNKAREELRPEDKITRAELVATVHDNGNISLRAMARTLNLDVGTLIRDLKIASLSDADKARIRSGASGNSILDEHKREAAANDIRRRKEVERTTHVESNKIADVLITALRSSGLFRGQIEDVLNKASHDLTPARFAALSRVNKPAQLAPDRVFELERNKAAAENIDSDCVEWFYRCLPWVERGLARTAMSWEIADRALEIALHYFKDPTHN
ncbi:MAG: hypothetical protein ACRD3Q_05150, partial [Terriglobales bacterium]